MKALEAIVIGAGDRGNVYASYSLSHPDELKIVGVAEPNPVRRKIFSEKYNIPIENQTESFEEILMRPKFADAVFITTNDNLHYKPAIIAYQKGYHILIEKPLSNNPYEIIKMAELFKNKEQVVALCHVLRYTSFFNVIKKIIESGEIGEIVAFQHNENIWNIHFAHSFVRGNWSNSNITSPVILSKSCHDLDLILWLTSKKIKKISSFGSLTYFNPKNKPQNAPFRCIDNCPHEISCPYSAIKIYLSEPRTWFSHKISDSSDFESLYKALKEGPYGRCVFQCDNNVCDHQVVNILMENDLTVSFTLSALTSEMSRTLKIMGTRGEIRARTTKNEIEVTDFNTNNIKRISAGKIAGGHYGGDINIVKSFIRAIKLNERELIKTDIETSIDSHLAAFAAEESRLSGTTIDYEEYVKNLYNKITK